MKQTTDASVWGDKIEDLSVLVIVLVCYTFGFGANDSKYSWYESKGAYLINSQIYIDSKPVIIVRNNVYNYST